MTVSLIDMINESDTDYSTGRLESAARGFEHVADTMSEQQMSDALYFYYRALQSYTEMDDLPAQSRLLNKIAGFCLNHSLRVLSGQMSGEHRIVAMDRSQLILKKQDKHEERRSLLTTLVDAINSDLDTVMDFEQRLNLSDKLLRFSSELLDMDRLDAAKLKVAQMIFDEYKDRLDSIDEFKQVIVGDRLLKSAQLFSELGNTNQSNKILGMIEKWDLPDTVLKKYDITGKDIIFIHADDILRDKFESRLLRVLIDQIKDKNYYVIITQRTGQIDHPYYIDYLRQLDRIIEIPRGVNETMFITDLIMNANAIMISNSFEVDEKLEAWSKTVKRAYSFDPSTNKYIIDGMDAI